METARSPDSRVSAKLTISTVRHTRRASARRRSRKSQHFGSLRGRVEARQGNQVLMSVRSPPPPTIRGLTARRDRDLCAYAREASFDAHAHAHAHIGVTGADRPARPANGPVGRRSRRPDRRGSAPAASGVTATCWSSRRRSSPRPRGARRAGHRQAVGPRRRAGRRGRQGPAPGRGDPVGIHARGAQPPEPADRAAPARLRDGQCRHRPVQRGAGRRRDRVLLLPEDPDGSAPNGCAHAWRHAAACGSASSSATVSAAPWRRGTAGVAIGAAGLPALIDLRGQPDLFGRTLEVSGSASPTRSPPLPSLLQGQADEALPVVLVRGLAWTRAGCAGCRPGAPARGGPVPMTVVARCPAASAAPSWRSA